MKHKRRPGEDRDIPDSGLQSTPSGKRLIHVLKTGANPSLRYNDCNRLLADMALRIDQEVRVHSNPDDLIDNLNVIQSLIKHYDYRLAADFLQALQTGDVRALQAYRHIEKRSGVAGDILYLISLCKFNRFKTPAGNAKTRAAASLDDVLTASSKEIVVYLSDVRLESPLMELTEKVGLGLSTFIELQHDLPSINALVCRGVTKKWFLPDGTAVVSKRNNPQKPGRFDLEQRNYEAIVGRLGGQSVISLSWQCLGTDGNEALERVQLNVVRPFSVIWDGYSREHYSLTEFIFGTSLDAVLLNENDQSIRHVYLIHYRLILDTLFDLGILWEDMSPRNIIIQRTESILAYYIFDFEKTRISKKPIHLANRRAFCRGQICAEEICTICTPDEVAKCFEGYFDPSEWNYVSDEVLPFPKRPEVADVLEGRGIRDASLGTYNQVDSEMLNARIPHKSCVLDQYEYPGRINFKVEHYLSCAGYDGRGYERKVTEILIAAKKSDCFAPVVAVLNEVANRAEAAHLRAEFEDILQGRGFEPSVPSKLDIDSLVDTIDSLYEIGKKRGMLAALYRAKRKYKHGIIQPTHT